MNPPCLCYFVTVKVRDCWDPGPHFWCDGCHLVWLVRDQNSTCGLGFCVGVPFFSDFNACCTTTSLTHSTTISGKGHAWAMLNWRLPHRAPSGPLHKPSTSKADGPVFIGGGRSHRMPTRTQRRLTLSRCTTSSRRWCMRHTLAGQLCWISWRQRRDAAHSHTSCSHVPLRSHGKPSGCAKSLDRRWSRLVRARPHQKCRLQRQRAKLSTRKSGKSTPDPDIGHETCQHLQRDHARIDKTFGLVSVSQ